MANLIINDTIHAQIKKLCKEIPNTEWGAVLFYSVVSGDFDNMSTLVLKAEYIYLAKIQSPAAVEYEFDENFMNEVFEFQYVSGTAERETWRLGTIHSHHKMNAYFSATDDADLKERAESENNYLSVVVNNEHKIVAAIGQSIETTYNIKLSNNQHSTKTKKQFYKTEVEIIYPKLEDEFFNDRLTQKLKEYKTTIAAKNKPVVIHGKTYNGFFEKSLVQTSVDDFVNYMLTGFTMYNSVNTSNPKTINSHTVNRIIEDFEEEFNFELDSLQLTAKQESEFCNLLSEKIYTLSVTYPNLKDLSQLIKIIND